MRLPDVTYRWARGGLARAVSLHVRADMRRYFFSMHPEPGDPHIAGGAVDQYLGLGAGLTVDLH